MRAKVVIGGALMGATLLFGASAAPSYVAALEQFLQERSFEVKGEFYAYDFGHDGRIDYNDWVYLSLSSGDAYRLLATTPTQENAFGFAPIQKPGNLEQPNGYFVFLNFTQDSDKKFSWVYVSRNSGSVYKLMGATPNHQFDYLDIDNDGRADPLPNITYRLSEQTIPGSSKMYIDFISMGSQSSFMEYSSSSSSESSSSSKSAISSLSSSSVSVSSSSSALSSYSYSSVTSATPTLTLPTRYMPNDGRLLAAGCYQCHGTNGYSINKWDSIAGEDMDEFYEDEHPLMSAQARGYAMDEVRKIFEWLRALPKKEGMEGDEEGDQYEEEKEEKSEVEEDEREKKIEYEEDDEDEED